jgi:hypothetical protein
MDVEDVSDERDDEAWVEQIATWLVNECVRILDSAKAGPDFRLATHALLTLARFAGLSSAGQIPPCLPLTGYCESTAMKRPRLLGRQRDSGYAELEESVTATPAGPSRWPMAGANFMEACRGAKNG